MPRRPADLVSWALRRACPRWLRGRGECRCSRRHKLMDAARMVRHDGRAGRRAKEGQKGWSLAKDGLTEAWLKHGCAVLRAGVYAAPCQGAATRVRRCS